MIHCDTGQLQKKALQGQCIAAGRPSSFPNDGRMLSYLAGALPAISQYFGRAFTDIGYMHTLFLEIGGICLIFQTSRWNISHPL
ncbi:MAG: hypothetical protein A4E45_01697 [Methanosaeta sp. PtaB.Bin039]|nr:MAG: hypothetical protein A4E45_01697 [Methanosaeta sp. PtaB.Bin039]OPY47708.1 MAG: hypothetical protein A4E47_00158 [Methanosaeta sp. PtaU1.Bin028]